jgi:hypothetical protein
MQKEKINFKRLYKQRRKIKQVEKLFVAEWDKGLKERTAIWKAIKQENSTAVLDLFKDVPKWPFRGNLTVDALVEAINTDSNKNLL